ncbi:hypothetical protein FRB97_007270 [Tulasnella sp. 331]|nr:hypothetical protein FRB97_007270 [Tulasnella sp. 331]
MLYAHNEIIVHGEFKLVNVLVDDSLKAHTFSPYPRAYVTADYRLRPKGVTNFGLGEIKQYAKLIIAVRDPRLSTGAGTLRYMSSEALPSLQSPPFLLAPDAVIYHHFSEMHKHLIKLADSATINRGLNDAMRRLIWDASRPLSADRPEFGTICKIAEYIVDAIEPMLNQGHIKSEGENSQDLFDLLDQEHRTTAVEFIPDAKKPLQENVAVEDRKVLLHAPPHTGPPHPTLISGMNYTILIILAQSPSTTDFYLYAMEPCRSVLAP